jgi:solute:Na+ symporter, SSS family
MEHVSLLSYVVIFFAVLFGATVLSRTKRTKDLIWVNNRSAKSWLVGVSLSSSIVGAGTLFGVVSAGYKGGMAGAFIGISNALGIILFGILAAPKINELGRERGWFSVGDPIREQYGNRVVACIAIVNLIAFFFLAATQFVALSKILSFLTQIEYGIALLGSTFIVLGYLAVGGIHTDMKADAFQIVVMSIGAVVLLASLLGGVSGRSLSELPAGYITGTAYAGVGFLLVAIVVLPLSVFVSLDVWQRAFTAENPAAAKRGFVGGGIAMAVLFTVFSVIGTIVWLMFPKIDPDSAILQAVTTILPKAFAGVVVVGLIAALLSTVDTMLLAAHVSLSHDLQLGKKLPDQVSIVALGIGAAAIAYVLPDIVKLLVSAFSSLLILAPTFLGLVRPHLANRFAAIASIIAGLSLTLVFIFIDPLMAFAPATIGSFITYFLVRKLKKS